jgi:hypothetical protein
MLFYFGEYYEYESGVPSLPMSHGTMTVDGKDIDGYAADQMRWYAISVCTALLKRK